MEKAERRMAVMRSKTGYGNTSLIYGLNLLLLFIFWGGLLRTNFNADTIYHMVVDDADVLTNIEAGRYIISLGDYLLLRLGLRVTTNISITMFLSFLFFALAMTVVYRIFGRWCPREKWNRLGFYLGLQLVFLNVLFSELLMFNECSLYFSFGYFMAALGVERFARKKYASMLLCLVFAVCSYQYTVIFASVLTAAYVCLEHGMRLSRKAALAELVGIGSCMGVGVCNLLSIKILEKTGVIIKFGKYAGVGTISEKLTAVCGSFLALNRNSDGILPNLWIPLLFGVFVWGILLSFCLKGSGGIQNGIQKNGIRLAFVFLVWLGSNVLLYIIPLAQEELFFPPRMSFCFYLVQGMLIIITYVIVEEKWRYVLTAGCGAYLFVHLVFAEFIVADRFVSNTLDEVYVQMMYQEVLRYEESTGHRITKLAVARDEDAPDGYHQVEFRTGQINERSLGTVTNSLVRVFAGRNLEIMEMPGEKYEAFFGGKNWDYFYAEEQLVFEEDKLYWCIF